MLFLAHRAVHDELDGRLHEHGASLWNWVLLREAADADGASQRELADLMRIEPPTLVRHLDKLADDGLVERRPDPERPPGRTGRRHRGRDGVGSPSCTTWCMTSTTSSAESSTKRDARGARSRAPAHPRVLRTSEQKEVAADART